ncbi:nucleoside-diphosphate-sugar epimerase [Trematosphaeria pertusa]|uniref:Nucleoside-diphosphate-sugar epimerase n=1 Tax=Trematosphaeria pertusa TaxID=390896 RepID=A0A6A6IYU1_9PLEO|nr:nucleoside-diphosphate-sugar epimerase [Trematosphaeria pertusa]KAF2255082.1 nucleoside-diphosphate-sugar epimerase [Trematosphaeria pertusa]
MRILITGAAGFIGQLVAKKLLNDEHNSHSLILTDIIEPPIPSESRCAGRAKAIKADLCTQSSLVVTQDIEAVYVFHGIMSSGAEADFELGMKANFDATRALLETIRKTCPGARVIYASSQAVYNNSVTMPVTEAQMPTPETSYGAEKMMCEYLVAEYTRRGFIDGISLRFPTVSVRPGKPTAAASSFLSGMIREPMNGAKCVIPIADRQWRHWLCSPRVLVRNLVYCAIELDLNRLAKFDRSLNVPGIGVSIQDMMDSLARVGGKDKLDLLEQKEEPTLKKILYSWPADFDNTKALELGFQRDTGFDEIVRDYKEGLAPKVNGHVNGESVIGISDEKALPLKVNAIQVEAAV